MPRDFASSAHTYDQVFRVLKKLSNLFIKSPVEGFYSRKNHLIFNLHNIFEICLR